MVSLDELKKRVKEESGKNPEKFFAVEALKEIGFERRTCKKCGRYFWSYEERDVCGDSQCSGGWGFIGDSPAKKSYGVIDLWEAFSDFFSKRGYTPIKRYPVAARWREDTEFVRASIYNFQPYVVSGEVEPPANPLIVPQPSIRFNDVDNVGITGSHYVLHIHVGQHAFTKPQEYQQDKYFRDLFDWINLGLGIPKKEIVLHEDAWGGGGNLGACMEFFVRGLELCNQVYMFYRVTDKGYEDLDTKVLDMGLGHERSVWICHGTETSYEVNMPDVMKYLYKVTGIKPNREIWTKFLPYSAYLNIDEVEDVESVWKKVSNEMSLDVKELKEAVLPVAALYSIAEHLRALLFALNDGMIPSNTGERHSLRMIFRRCLDFMERYGWDIDIHKVVETHARFMKGMYPELTENLENVKKILDVETEKYERNKKESMRIIEGLKGKRLTEKDLVELYDSHGIHPDFLRRQGFEIDVPADFYSKVAERHVHVVKEEEQRFDVSGIPETKKLYYEDEKMLEFEAKVIKVLDEWVVLDRTAFYPTSGGQEHDTGHLNRKEVVDVIVERGVVLHKVPGHDFREGQVVQGSVDRERRKQLSVHHTSTHVMLLSARKVLGTHVYQHSAHKDVDKARLDITHYTNLTDEEVEEIERVANDVIKKDYEVLKRFMPRREAEDKYGFVLYQGGVPPGKTLRVVSIDDLDHQGCGGTHLDRTSEIGLIRILGWRKVQDGVIRLEFVAGEVARKKEDEARRILEECKKMVGEDVIKGVEDLKRRWKENKKRIEGLREKLSEKLSPSFKSVSGLRVLVRSVESAGPKDLQKISLRLSGDDTVILLVGTDDRLSVFGSAGKVAVEKGVNIGEVVREVSQELGGKGGGTPGLGQGFGTGGNIEDVLKKAEEIIWRMLGKS